jgi:membrane-bound metal-dependent hydrolase YbcI (DUF457 family)
MAGFRAHITTSGLLGVAYAGAGYALGIPYPSCVIAGGLCGLAGMLPDLDSDSGVPVRETTSLAAAVVPLLMIDRFQHMGLTTEEIVLAAAGIYLLIRFGVASIFKLYTVHRGMWHSLPAAFTAALLGYLACSSEYQVVQIYKAGGVFLGFVSHLVLDELNSLEVRRGRLRIKRSFGTALKLWSRSTWANVSTYGKLLILMMLVFGDRQYFRQHFDQYEHKIHAARQAMNGALQDQETLLR